ncbi:MAG: hypothetical protein C4B58_15300 [Deltaproteobacteria bacterium]|nr:MAG: hypothetical protein C4B58_15300 [Deltaproteobacteria bacterium]
MMKMRRWGLFLALALSFSLVMLNSSVLAGNISEPYPVQFLSFIQYHVVETNWDGDIYTRTIRLEVQNTSDQALSNVTVTIDGYPEHVTSSDNDILLRDMGPGATVIGNDVVEISVDMSRQNGSDLKLIWRVECDIDGERIMDETSVVETLE